MRRFIRWLGVLTVVGVVAAVAAFIVWQRMTEEMLTRPLPVAAGDALIVPEGTSFREFTGLLAARDLLEHPILLLALARVDDDTGRLLAGEYRLAPDMTLRDLLDNVASGEVIQHRFTIVEGWSFADLRQALARYPVIEHDPKNPSDSELMAAIGHPGQHPEGRFLPETYRFPRGVTDISFLRRAHDAMTRVLEQAWEERAGNTPVSTPYEALILASIIEKETGAKGERRRIAGVFARRLDVGMRLQTDPTVIYGMGEAYDGRIRTKDLRTDTPYNTYTRHGLPPTPIAMPGRAAITAALSPQPGSALYFVSRGDGTHQFSDSLEEHNRAVRKYILGER